MDPRGRPTKADLERELAALRCSSLAVHQRNEELRVQLQRLRTIVIQKLAACPCSAEQPCGWCVEVQAAYGSSRG